MKTTEEETADTAAVIINRKYKRKAGTNQSFYLNNLLVHQRLHHVCFYVSVCVSGASVVGPGACTHTYTL